MAANKTKATDGSVDGYFSAIEDDARREDCVALAKLMTKATKHPPKMWGAGIVGFGSYHYKYESGREGDSCLVGFSSRKGEIAIYLVGDFPGRDELLGKLGKHKTAKACLYVRRLSDIDLKVLEQLVVASVKQRKLNHA
ncbi:MAG TPA: DUF1801 domain-containing protein [Thermoanaerobaculia bacterium]|jgi:hypothetical protein|nr:DUF1801 domain-containing protein [Thermoanaerobaculia bacterium]